MQRHFDLATDIDATLAEPGRMVSGVRSLSAVVVRCWLRLYHQFTIVGSENLPLDRSFVMIANHTSHLDTLCLLSALPIERLHQTYPLAAKDYFCAGVFRSLVARVFANALPFDRCVAPWESLSACSQLLERPSTVLIFYPEGTRGDGTRLAEFKAGVALLVAGRDIPVIPCHLAGANEALPKGAWLPRPSNIRLTIGSPHNYAHLSATKDSARHISHELREAVMRMETTSKEKS